MCVFCFKCTNLLLCWWTMLTWISVNKYLFYQHCSFVVKLVTYNIVVSGLSIVGNNTYCTEWVFKSHAIMLYNAVPPSTKCQTWLHADLFSLWLKVVVWCTMMKLGDYGCRSEYCGVKKQEKVKNKKWDSIGMEISKSLITNINNTIMYH